MSATPLTEELVQKVADYVTERGPSEETIQSLRSDFEGIQFTYCFDDDVCGPKPVFENDSFCLYTIRSSDHCTSFIPSIEAATGLVVAEIDDFCA